MGNCFAKDAKIPSDEHDEDKRASRKRVDSLSIEEKSNEDGSSREAHESNEHCEEADTDGDDKITPAQPVQQKQDSSLGINSSRKDNEITEKINSLHSDSDSNNSNNSNNSQISQNSNNSVQFNDRDNIQDTSDNRSSETESEQAQEKENKENETVLDDYVNPKHRSPIQLIDNLSHIEYNVENKHRRNLSTCSSITTSSQDTSNGGKRHRKIISITKIDDIGDISDSYQDSEIENEKENETESNENDGIGDIGGFGDIVDPTTGTPLRLKKNQFSVSVTTPPRDGKVQDKNGDLNNSENENVNVNMNSDQIVKVVKYVHDEHGDDSDASVIYTDVDSDVDIGIDAQSWQTKKETKEKLWK